MKGQVMLDSTGCFRYHKAVTAKQHFSRLRTKVFT
jgi:hypothetical protein